MTPSCNASVTFNTQQAAIFGGGPSSDLELPYTPDEMTQLDLSIVLWLKEIG